MGPDDGQIRGFCGSLPCSVAPNMKCYLEFTKALQQTAAFWLVKLHLKGGWPEGS